jgi:predicted dehydrogenase
MRKIWLYHWLQNGRIWVINPNIVGRGYWGPNLLRNFAQLDGCKVKYCCDLKDDNLKRAKALCPEVEATNSFESLLEDSEVQALVIATSAATHWAILMTVMVLQNVKNAVSSMRKRGL